MIEDPFLESLQKKMLKFIEKEAKRHGVDLAYYEFEVKVSVLNNNFELYRELVLVDTREQHFCSFCRKKAHFYYRPLEGYLCAKCYVEVMKKEEGG